MRSQKGIVLIFVLLMVLAIMAAVVGVLYSSQISQYVGRADRNATTAERVAQTGLDKYRTTVFQEVRDVVANGSSQNLFAGTGDGPACNLLINAPKGDQDKIDLSREGDGFGRYQETLNISKGAASGPPSMGTITSVGQVLTGHVPSDPLDFGFKPPYPYPEAVLHQTLYAHNASLMSHALVTKELDSAGNGFAVAGPIFISGNKGLTVGGMGDAISAVDGDLVPFDYWPCLDLNKDGKYECGPNGADQTVLPARPWVNQAPGLDAIDLSGMLAEGGQQGPASLCTRIRMPGGYLTGSNEDNDPATIGQLYNITGVHVGIRPDIGGSPVRASTRADVNPVAKNDLAVAAGFQNRPSLTTPYDLDPIPNPDSADTYKGELEVPTGLADYYGSKGVNGEQRKETVKDLKGGEKNLEVAEPNNADITISYEWLRVNQDGNMTTYYVHGLEKPDSCTGGSRVKHPDYETSSKSNAWLVQPPTTCLQSMCIPCMILVPFRWPETGEPDTQAFPDPFPLINPGGDIVWPTTDARNGDKHIGCTGNINADGTPCLGQGGIALGGNADLRIPKFNLNEKLVCTKDGSEPPSPSNPGFVWDPQDNELTVEGTVALEGIEFDVGGRPEIRAQGDGVMVLREREIRLIADNKSYEVQNKTCIGVKIGWPPKPCSCKYDAIVEADDISLPTTSGDETGKAQGALPTTSYPDEPDIKEFYFALFQHGGKAGYQGSSPNDFKQDLPSWALPESSSGWGEFPKKPDASIPMIVSDPKYLSELNDEKISGGSGITTKRSSSRVTRWRWAG